MAGLWQGEGNPLFWGEAESRKHLELLMFSHKLISHSTNSGLCYYPISAVILESKSEKLSKRKIKIFFFLCAVVAPKGLLELLITLINVSTNLPVMAPRTWAHVAGVICAAVSPRA